MKMIYGGVPVNSMKIKHYEMDTNSATVQPSDLQAGVTCFAKGRKITGTGKCFEFANYGRMSTNLPMFIPNGINVIQIASVEYPIKSLISFSVVTNVDFSTPQVIGKINIDGSDTDITLTIEGNILTLTCSNMIYLEVFYGKDNWA